MKYIFLLLLVLSQLVAGIVKVPVVTVDNDKEIATINVPKIDVGMSGFIVHHLTDEHTSILKSVVVQSFDEASQSATLKMSDFDGLRNNALPTGQWSVQEGDSVVLAFGYSRAILIAPSEEIYYRITKSVSIQWLHPDIFATILSFNGHPTPLKSDFENMSNATSTGLIFIYLNERLYTVDAKSFVILNITDAKLTQDSMKLPFYSRVDEIDEAWFGEGNDPLEDYEPHYYKLLVDHNAKNKQLYEIVKNGDEKLQFLINEFKIGE